MTQKNTFNRTAEKLGCLARIGGNKKKIELQMFLGYCSKDNREWVVKIDSKKFSQLIANFPELH